MSKERPILFSAPMVRALLDGSKLQTRRVIKTTQPEWVRVNPNSHPDTDGRQCYGWDGNIGQAMRCPYGHPGDRLWVREAWMPDPPCDGTWGYTEWAGNRIGQIAAVPERFQLPAFCNYHASWPHGSHDLRWTPSIHMPRWASRITLEVTGVRVERLQDISEADAVAEGISRIPPPVADHGWSGPNRFTLRGMGKGLCAGHVNWNAPTAKALYQRLWESINGPESLEANPWVWVVEFKVVKP